jgi:hypothetical protein
MRRRHLYLLLAAVGLVGPYGFFVSFLTTHGLDGKEFLSELFGTRISTFFAVDLILSCVVFLVYLRQETARYSIQHRWLYVLALVTVGLSFALPLFLYARERRLELPSEKEGRSA